MIIEHHDTGKEILVVAEIGNNHEGSYALAEEMIGKAVDAGVGAVKFQTFLTERFINLNEKARFEKLKSFELTFDQFERLAKATRDSGVLFLSTPFDIESAKFLNTIVPAFKIASGDINFYPLLKVVAQTGKPVIFSGGASNLEQIRDTKAFIESTWSEMGVKSELAVLHCVAQYPVVPSKANLRSISHLKKELKCEVGYSDHTIGIEAALLSIALGARIIEKHFTLDKNYSEFRDHQLSADPREMKDLVRKLNEIEALLGSEQIQISEGDKKSAALLRRSIAASRDIPEATTIGWDDITWLRPAGGLSPGAEEQVLGKQLSKAVKKGDLLVPEILR